MLFLFLTGRRLAYANDILSILYLPKGVIKTLKYKDTKSLSIVDKSAKYDKCRPGDDVLILYYNKDNKKREEFIPLRYGRLSECISEDEQLYYKVELKEFVNVVDGENRVSEFNWKIYSMLYPNVEEREKAKRKGEHVKWIYAFRKLSAMNQYKDCLNSDQDSWIRTVQQVSKTTRFKKYYSIFAKINVLNSKNKEESCKADGYRFRAGRTYKLILSYFVPEFNEHPFEQIHIEFSDAIGVCRIPNSNYMIESEQNRIEILFRPMKVDSDGQTNLWLNIPMKKIHNKSIYYPRGAIAVSVGWMSIGCKRAATIATISGIGVVNFLTQFPYIEKLEQLEHMVEREIKLSRLQEFWFWFCEVYQDAPETFVSVMSIITAFLTFLLVKLIGKAQI